MPERLNLLFIFTDEQRADTMRCYGNELIQTPNLNALVYAARVARAPYQNAPGPDAISLMSATLGNALRITATLTSDHVISAARVFIDSPPWAGGVPLAMLAADGAFNQTTEIVSVELPPLDGGRHTAFVRGQDNAGNWGPVSAVFLDATLPFAIYLPLIWRP